MDAGITTKQNNLIYYKQKATRNIGFYIFHNSTSFFFGYIYIYSLTVVHLLFYLSRLIYITVLFVGHFNIYMLN